eukprot:2155673-Rhodomonas_salina.1
MNVSSLHNLSGGFQCVFSLTLQLLVAHPVPIAYPFPYYLRTCAIVYTMEESDCIVRCYA